MVLLSCSTSVVFKISFSGVPSLFLFASGVVFPVASGLSSAAADLVDEIEASEPRLLEGGDLLIDGLLEKKMFSSFASSFFLTQVFCC